MRNRARSPQSICRLCKIKSEMTGRKSSCDGALARLRSWRASMLGKAQSLVHLRPGRARQRRLRRTRPVRLRHRRLRGVRRRASSSVSSPRPVRRRPLCPRFSVRRTPLPTRPPKGGTVACAGADAQLLPRHREMDHSALPLPPAHHQNFSPRPLTSKQDPPAGRLRSRYGGPRPAGSPPLHMPTAIPPGFTRLSCAQASDSVRLRHFDGCARWPSRSFSGHRRPF